MIDEAQRRYPHINLPHVRTIVARIERALAALGALGPRDESGMRIAAACDALRKAAEPFDEDPPVGEALSAADVVAAKARVLVDAVLETPHRGDRLGQHVRNLFECLGLAEEGATLSLICGENPDSPLRH